MQCPALAMLVFTNRGLKQLHVLPNSPFQTLLPLGMTMVKSSYDSLPNVLILSKINLLQFKSSNIAFLEEGDSQSAWLQEPSYLQIWFSVINTFAGKES